MGRRSLHWPAHQCSRLRLVSRPSARPQSRLPISRRRSPASRRRSCERAGRRIRIVGSQDVVYRETFGSPEVLVLNAGTSKDIKVNNLYYVRRLYRTAET